MLIPTLTVYHNTLDKPFVWLTQLADLKTFSDHSVATYRSVIK
jgi:hypothetical protein